MVFFFDVSGLVEHMLTSSSLIPIVRALVGLVISGEQEERDTPLGKKDEFKLRFGRDSKTKNCRYLLL